jgi:hypothetical protein
MAAKKKPGNLCLNDDAQDELGQAGEAYRDATVSIARGLAHSEESSKVEARHVQEARRTLIRQGLRRSKLPTTAELTSLGAAGAMSLTIAFPDWLPDTMESDSKAIVKYIVLCFGFFVAILLYFFAYILNRR